MMQPPGEMSPQDSVADGKSPDLESLLEGTVRSLTAPPCPPRMAQALRHAVLGGGHRLRPRLCWAVVQAHGQAPSPLAEQAAVALEMLHCASLVHDDLPCFDDAPLRRGQPSVQQAFGEATAVLAGDALIVAAFEWLAREQGEDPVTAIRLVRLLAQAAGVPQGIAAGQAWESEPTVTVRTYHDSKTAVLYEAAARAGALTCGVDPAPWGALGQHLGRAYQLADDLLDVHDTPVLEAGKPLGRDRALGRPNAALSLGRAQTRDLLREMTKQALNAVPSCPHPQVIRSYIAMFFACFSALLERETRS